MNNINRSSFVWNLILKIHKIYFLGTHIWGRITGNFYFEDYFRVYPDGTSFNIFGFKKSTREAELKNYLNHLKFYKFVDQFVKNKIVSDLGCGSGYGCKELKEAGAKRVYGADASKHSINYAKSKFSKFAKFSVQNIADLKEYKDDNFDVSVSAEVLEHIKEYKMEGAALDEMKRITKKDGLIIIGTPNNEIVENHGFSYKEILRLIEKRFKKFCIFENALTPFDDRKSLWKKRLLAKNTGIIVSQLISLEEIALIDNQRPEFKKGIKPGKFKFSKYQIDTKLLHNTHSWIVIAINEK